MKIIDLLVKIANGEEVPKKFKFKNSSYNKEFYFDGDIYKYKDYDGEYAMTDDISIEIALNDEIEIIEEKKIPKKLKSLNKVGSVPDLVEFTDKQQLNNHLLKNKINEIIDYLKSKGE